MLAYLLLSLESTEDREHFTFIYDRYHTKLEQVAISILNNQCDAEDALQNTYLQVIRHFKEACQVPVEQLEYWLTAIAKNEARMILRKKKRLVCIENWDEIEDTSESVSNYRQLVEIIQRLPETYRAVLEMKLILGYSDREIGLHLGISETAVSTRASRGRALLRRMIEKEGFFL